MISKGKRRYICRLAAEMANRKALDEAIAAMTKSLAAHYQVPVIMLMGYSK
jgi:hypothetical protein